jgi:hypothetical protein
MISARGFLKRRRVVRAAVLPGPGPSSTVASLVSLQQHRKGDGADGGQRPGPPAARTRARHPAVYQEIQDQTRNRRLFPAGPKWRADQEAALGGSPRLAGCTRRG